jgi:serine/threonine-protein kinase
VIQTVRSRSGGSDTEAGTAIGTFAYMPSEQADGEIEKVDERADVFALGSILCEVLTGAPAYTGRTRDEVRRKAVRGDLADARSRLGACGADAELIALARDCLATEAIDRPRDAGVVSQRISAHLAAVQEQLEAAKLVRVAAETRAIEERKRRYWQLGLAGAAVIAVLLGGAWSYDRRLRAIKERQAQVQAAAAKAEAEARLVLRVREVLQAARALIELGWTQTDDYARWRISLDRAETELNRAEEAHALGASSPAIRDELRQARAKWEQAVEAQRIGEEADRILTEIVRANASREAYTKASTQIERLFQRHDIHVLDASESQRTIDWVRAHPIKNQLSMLLAAWWSWTPWTDPNRLRLQPVVHALDPPFAANYTRWMFAIATRNGQQLAALAQDPEVARLPHAGKVLMAFSLKRARIGFVTVRFLEHWQSLNPDYYWFNFMLGTLLRREPANALPYAMAAVALKPDEPGAHLALALLYEDTKDLAKAGAELGRVIALDPKSGEAHYALGRVLAAEHKFEDAVRELGAASQLVPPDSETAKAIAGSIREFAPRISPENKPGEVQQECAPKA